MRRKVSIEKYEKLETALFFGTCLPSQVIIIITWHLFIIMTVDVNSNLDIGIELLSSILFQKLFCEYPKVIMKLLHYVLDHLEINVINQTA